MYSIAMNTDLDIKQIRECTSGFFLQESIGKLKLIPAMQRAERQRDREGGSHFFFAASADGEGRE
jgi:hypothetical protein